MTVFFILYFICGYFACGYACNLIYTMKYPEQKDKATLMVFLTMWPMYLGLIINCIFNNNNNKKQPINNNKCYIYEFSKDNIHHLRYEVNEKTIEIFDGKNWIQID